MLNFIKELLTDSHTIADCLDFLCDGAALSALGFTDTEEVEEAFNFLAQQHTRVTQCNHKTY